MLQDRLMVEKPTFRLPAFIYASVFLGTMFVTTMILIHSHDKSKMDHEYRMKELEVNLSSSLPKTAYNSSPAYVEEPVQATKKSKFW